MSFKPLKSLLAGALEGRSPLKRGVRGAVVLDAAREVVEAVFPARVAGLITPAAFSGVTVTLAVRSPVVSQEIRMRGAEFIQTLNKRLGQGAVKQIRIRLAPLEADQGGF